MKIFGVLTCAVLLSTVIGCASNAEIITFPLKGTDTAVVRITLADTKMPGVIEETVVIKVGQRMVWVGPENFVIRFPEESPFEQKEFKSRDSVISIEIPKSAKRFFSNGKKRVKFKYDVIFEDQVLDPHLILIEG